MKDVACCPSHIIVGQKTQVGVEVLLKSHFIHYLSKYANVNLTSLFRILESKSLDMNTSTRGSNMTANLQVRPKKENQECLKKLLPLIRNLVKDL